MNKKKMLNIVHVGVSGFPFGSAANYTCIFRYKSLVESGAKVLLINNRPVHNKDFPFKIDKEGFIEGQKYIYTSLSPYRSDKFIVRRISNFFGKLNEVLLIIKLKVINDIDILIFYPTGSFFDLMKYRFISKIINIPLIVHYVEYRTAFQSRKNRLFLRINDYLFDKFICTLSDAVLPISEYLISHLKKSNCKKNYLKIPPIVDFNNFKKTKHIEDNYFIYCGSAVYFSAISLVINSFSIINNGEYFLYLVVNGNSEQMKKVNSLIKNSEKKENIKIYSKLIYTDLVQLYMNANAMLIPLSDSIKDKARFPYKISEYTATGNPIITTNYGEIKNYFEDMITALVTDKYQIKEFANKMQFVIDNPEKAKKIGKHGKNIGFKYFHYANYGDEMLKLITKIKFGNYENSKNYKKTIY